MLSCAPGQGLQLPGGVFFGGHQAWSWAQAAWQQEGWSTASLGVFVPLGALPCRLGGWGEGFTIPPTRPWAALLLPLCSPLAPLTFPSSKAVVPPRLCIPWKGHFSCFRSKVYPLTTKYLQGVQPVFQQIRTQSLSTQEEDRAGPGWGSGCEP